LKLNKRYDGLSKKRLVYRQRKAEESRKKRTKSLFPCKEGTERQTKGK
jgi:hypothetical protein